MDIETLTSVLGWSAVINYGVLLYWFGMFVLAHDWLYRVHGRWFSVRVETFDAIHYALMGGFKLCIFVFNLVPYLVISIVA